MLRAWAWVQEQVNKQGYNEKSDIWSLGCLLYEMVALKPPFSGADERSLGIKINECRVPRLPAKYSDELNAVVRSMLVKEPLLRPTMQSILALPALRTRAVPPPSAAKPPAPSVTTTKPELDEYRRGFSPTPHWTSDRGSHVGQAPNLTPKHHFTAVSCAHRAALT